MHLRQLLNVAYARLALGRDDDQVAELDELLESEPAIEGAAKRKKRGMSSGMKALFAAAALPQEGVGSRPKPTAEGVK